MKVDAYMQKHGLKTLMQKHGLKTLEALEVFSAHSHHSEPSQMCKRSANDNVCESDVKTEPVQFHDMEQQINDWISQKDDGQSEVCEADVKTEPTEIAEFDQENRNHEKSILGP